MISASLIVWLKNTKSGESFLQSISFPFDMTLFLHPDFVKAAFMITSHYQTKKYSAILCSISLISSMSPIDLLDMAHTNIIYNMWNVKMKTRILYKKRFTVNVSCKFYLIVTKISAQQINKTNSTSPNIQFRVSRKK